ncbi:Zinc/iron permease [Russula brevipes]|nr:Zinc/iron permease [Russula brevipes]
MSRLSSLGTGLLLGAALGIIIPEGIEALARTRDLDGPSIALPLLVGFTFMLIIEQLSSSSHHHHHPRAHRTGHQPAGGHASPDSVFDVELAALEDEAGHEHGGASAPLHARRASADTGVEGDVSVSSSANAITIGLVVHSLADGLALGMSMLPGDESPSSHSYGLSLVVFLALAVHKAPTSLAYTVSLMSTSLSRAECRKHLLLFSASTPVGAIASYAAFSFFGLKQADDVGTALLISAGSFLYVAAVLQPVSHDRSTSEGVGTKTRILLIIIGIFTPFLLGTLIDH